MPGGRRLAAVTERTNVLFTLASLAGEETAHRAASTWLKQAASELQEVPASPMRSRWLVEILTRLGDAQRLAGDYDDARDTLQQAYAEAQGANADCLALAGVLNTLGILSKETGRYDEAADRYDAALQLMVGEIGKEDPRLAALHHNLAGLAHVHSRYVDAEPHIRTALALRARADPPDTAGYASDTAVLGAVLTGQGRLEEAEQVLLDAKARWVDLRGPDHYEVAVQLHNLAFVHQQRGDLLASAEAYTQALSIKQAVLGDQHPEIAALHHNLAALLAELQKYREALEHSRTALQIYVSTLGPDHPDTRVCAAQHERLRPPA